MVRVLTPNVSAKSETATKGFVCSFSKIEVSRESLGIFSASSNCLVLCFYPFRKCELRLKSSLKGQIQRFCCIYPDWGLHLNLHPIRLYKSKSVVKPMSTTLLYFSFKRELLSVCAFLCGRFRLHLWRCFFNYFFYRWGIKVLNHFSFFRSFRRLFQQFFNHLFFCRNSF